MYTDAYELYQQYANLTVEISFMEGTESCNKFGRTVVGLVTLPNDSDTYIQVIIPHGKIDITKGLIEKWETKQFNAKLGLIVNVGCAQMYNISEENIQKLKGEGFSVTHIEYNGIRKI